MIMGGCIASVMLTSSSMSVRQGCCRLPVFPHFGNLSDSSLSPGKGDGTRDVLSPRCPPPVIRGQLSESSVPGHIRAQLIQA